MDRVGLVGAGNEIVSVKARGAYTRADHAQRRPDSQFISATSQPAVRRPEAHLVEGRRRRELHELEARRLGPVQPDRPLHVAGLRLQQEPELLAEGQAEDSLPRVRPGGVERRGAGSDPEGAGRLDAQLRSERREGVRREGQEALPRLLCEAGVPDLAHPRHDEVPVQHHRVPQGVQPGDRPQDRVEARRVRVRTADGCDRPQWPLPGLGHEPRSEEAREADGDLQPGRCAGRC